MSAVPPLAPALSSSDTPPRAVGYVRVSTYREEKISPELQAAAIEAHCRRAGYRLLEIRQDLDATGRNFARTEVQRTISKIESGEAEVIVVWKVSRFGRNRRDWYVNNDRVEVGGGRLESATEDFDSATSVGRFTRGMLVELAAFESDRIGDVWREVHERRLIEGKPSRGGDRFGYERVAGVYVPDADTSQLLIDMYSWYVAGVGFSGIAQRLNGAGSRTLAGGMWSRDRVTRVMDSGFGAGQLVKGRGTVAQYVPGAHEAVVSPDLWEAYLAGRRRRRGQAPASSAPKYVLSGLIRCGDCERPMHSSRLGKKAGYAYVCSVWHSTRGCRCVSITRMRAEAEVLLWLREVATDVDSAARIHERRADLGPGLDNERDRLAQQASRVAAQLDKATRGWAEGKVPDDAYDRLRDSLIGEQQALSRRLTMIDHERSNLEVPIAPIAVGLIEEWDTLPVPERRELLRSLVAHVTILRPHGPGAPRIVITPR
ncbi:recombinase family protein [Humibacillus xanthopallidus]|uniref:recombinase family protein n=1 Tax=Humibacillus xanthopallidus TaxID=412689 RepID=UPI00384EC265